MKFLNHLRIRTRLLGAFSITVLITLLIGLLGMSSTANQASSMSSMYDHQLVAIAERARNLKGHGLDEGISTRMLIYAGSLIAQGVVAQAACRVALVRPITDDPDMRDALDAAVATFF